MLLGLMKQGLQCRDCKVNVHKKCAFELAINCRLNDGIIGPAATAAAASALPAIDQMSVSDDSSLADNYGEETSADQMIPLVRLPGQASVRYIVSLLSS